MATHVDSVDKIVTRYFACMTKEDFEYKGVIYKAKPLAVSPLLLRDYTCPAMCGACCPRFSLDYLPSERPEWSTIKMRKVWFNGQQIQIWSDMQRDHTNHFCRHLKKVEGRCGIYEHRPFSCDFELIRTLAYSNPGQPNILTQKLYGRKWNMLRVDGERGTLCEMLPSSDHAIAEVKRKLRRMENWGYHFGIQTWALDIIRIIDLRLLTKQIVLDPKRKKGLVY